MGIEVDGRAPDFRLPDQHGRETTLTEYSGRRAVALVFFPLAFSPTCQNELCALRDDLGAFAARDVQLLAVSVDSKHTLRAWSEQEGFAFPLLSDFWPHGAVARDYGVFLPERGFADRASFLIDGSGRVRWRVLTAPGVPRPIEAYHSALAALD